MVKPFSIKDAATWILAKTSTWQGDNAIEAAKLQTWLKGCATKLTKTGKGSATSVLQTKANYEFPTTESTRWSKQVLSKCFKFVSTKDTNTSTTATHKESAHNKNPAAHNGNGASTTPTHNESGYSENPAAHNGNGAAQSATPPHNGDVTNINNANDQSQRSNVTF